MTRKGFQNYLYRLLNAAILEAGDNSLLHYDNTPSDGMIRCAGEQKLNSLSNVEFINYLIECDVDGYPGAEGN